MSDDTDDTAPDEAVHESTLLASAYLDGEVTPDERALVETSTETLAEVDAMTQVSAVLAATAPTASLSEREAHLAGALDVWERMSDLERSGEATPAAGVDAAAAAAVLTPTSTSEGRRARGARTRGRSFGTSQWLLGAAATLVVVAGAAAVFRGILNEDRADNDVAVEQAADDGAELSEVEANEAAEVEGRNVGTELIVADPESIADEAMADPDGGGLFPEDDAMEEAEIEPSADADQAAPATQPAPPAEVERVELDSPEALADFGSLILIGLGGGPLTTDDTEFEPPFNSCEAEFGVEEVLEPARYQGQDVVVGVDLDAGIVYAYTEDCVLVESVPLPTPTTQP